MLIAVNPAGEVLLERRPPAGVWGGLWSLPECSPEQDIADWCRSRLGVHPHRVEKLAVRRHTFSHFHLDIRPIRVELLSEPGSIADDRAIWCDPQQPGELGLAAPVSKILREITDDPKTPRGEFT